MQFDLYGNYARAPDGTQMHSDVLVPTDKARETPNYATEWLDSNGFSGAGITLERCRFYHSERSASPKIEHVIECEGYFVLQIEGCPSPTF